MLLTILDPTGNSFMMVCSINSIKLVVPIVELRKDLITYGLTPRLLAIFNTTTAPPFNTNKISYIMTNKIDQFRIAKQSIEISKAPWKSLFYKFLKGEFSEEDFQEIYGESLGSHFFARYDNGDGIVSLFRQFSDGNATPLLNLFLMERERPGAASFQIYKTKMDRNGNSRKCINIYNADGSLKTVIRYAVTTTDKALINSGFNPKILAMLPPVNISVEAWKGWINAADENNQLKHEN